jgi:hypothetical protein
MGIRGITIVWFILASTVFSTVLSPKTCRPPLPIDWFISEFQSPPKFSQNITNMATAASAALASFVNKTLAHTSDVDAVSVVVAGPWGVVDEHHIGKLKANDSSDHRTVDGNSIYRVASMSKVQPPAS